MYILLTIKDITITNTLQQGADFPAVALATDPLIVNELPETIQANTKVNIKNADGSSLEKNNNNTPALAQYDYYFDCGDASADVVKETLKRFTSNYPSNLQAKMVDTDSPDIIPVVAFLQLCLNNQKSVAALKLVDEAKTKDENSSFLGKLKVGQYATQRNLLFAGVGVAAVGAIAAVAYYKSYGNSNQ
jgi:hypothetical protein